MPNNEYDSAYQSIWEGNEFERHKLSPTARSLFVPDINGVPFPYGSEEENEAFIRKNGPEKAIRALESLIGHQKQREGKLDSVNADIVRGSRQENEKYRDEILSRQGY